MVWPEGPILTKKKTGGASQFHREIDVYFQKNLKANLCLGILWYGIQYEICSIEVKISPKNRNTRKLQFSCACIKQPQKQKANSSGLDLWFGACKLEIQTSDHDLNILKLWYTSFCWIRRILDYNTKQLVSFDHLFYVYLMHGNKTQNLSIWF